jgi:hypothetical protein
MLLDVCQSLDVRGRLGLVCDVLDNDLRLTEELPELSVLPGFFQ